jgi:hypothetical protein
VSGKHTKRVVKGRSTSGGAGAGSMATRARSHSTRVAKVSTMSQASVTREPGPEVLVCAQSTQTHVSIASSRHLMW